MKVRDLIEAIEARDVPLDAEVVAVTSAGLRDVEALGGTLPIAATVDSPEQRKMLLLVLKAPEPQEA